MQILGFAVSHCDLFQAEEKHEQRSPISWPPLSVLMVNYSVESGAICSH